MRKGRKKGIIKKKGFPQPSAPMVTEGFVPKVHRHRFQERIWNITQCFKGSLRCQKCIIRKRYDKD